MKRLFLFLVMVAGLLSFTESKAQNATLISLAAGDTLVASSSKDTVSKVIRVTAGYSALSFQVNATKLSGTVNLKAYLYGSLDGTNYVVTDSSAAFADQTTNVVQFTKTTAPFTYQKVEVRNSTGVNTTQSVICRFYYVFRKHD